MRCRRRAHRGGRPLPVQAHGDQGRVRGGAPLHLRHVQITAGPRVRALGPARAAPGRPLLARRDPVTGEPKKRRFGPWMLKAMAVLARFRRLRGTLFDPSPTSTSGARSEPFCRPTRVCWRASRPSCRQPITALPWRSRACPSRSAATVTSRPATSRRPRPGRLSCWRPGAAMPKCSRPPNSARCWPQSCREMTSSEADRARYPLPLPYSSQGGRG